MYQIDFTKPIRIHFIGIGGISMSGLAELLHTKGFTISGSDAKQSKITTHLTRLGIPITIGHHFETITPDLDLVVYTAAIKPENLEFQAVLAHNIPMMDRASLLGQVMKQYKNAISISGTHGKTTTTSMVSLMMLEANLDPTISVGGILDNIEGNIKIGNSENFIVESCEYKNSFLSFSPTHEIILNIEAEHLDFFKDLDDIRHSFRLFAKKIPDFGNLVINAEIDNYMPLIEGLSCHIHTYGIKRQDSDNYNYMATNISFNEYGCGSYDLLHNQKVVDRIQLGVVGEHNISNSLAAIALVDQLGVPIEAIKKALLDFKGTERRFEYKGSVGDVTIIDDYAHHPTEITATLKAAHSYPHHSIWCVFQPHTYTRTKLLFSDFIQALSNADHIVLADIYAAREEDPGDISSKDLQNKLCELGKDAYYFNSFEKIENFLLKNCTNGDLLITMGAGDVVSIGETLLGK